MFLAELHLNLTYLDEMVSESGPADARAQKQIRAFRDNVEQGILYYVNHLSLFGDEQQSARHALASALLSLQGLCDPEARSLPLAAPAIS